jgi:phenylpropionate dioxygenase-like ring-hydroxylating dioxygenase large terminal subunit
MIRSRVPLNFPWALGTKKTKASRMFGGNKLVMFPGKNGETKVIDDTCPHRGAMLSKGKVVGDCIQCPYHGWLFNGDGRLIHVPTSNIVPKKSDVMSYPVEELYDFVWSVPEDSLVSPPLYPTMEGEGWHMVTGSHEVKGNWIDWVANATDISHINYVHDFADENNGSVDQMTVENSTDRTKCTAWVRPKAAHLFTRHMQVERSPIVSEFIYPNTTIIHIKLKEPYEFVTYTTLTPVNKTTTRITWCFAHNINLGDPMMMRMLNEHFQWQMKKTISEDEAIISEIPEDFNFKVNVSCDKFQTTVLNRLHGMLVDNEENLFYILK